MFVGNSLLKVPLKFGAQSLVNVLGQLPPSREFWNYADLFVQY
ncbi:MAG: hypothetical protein ACTHL3_05985 [Candidatus Nitrosocosmicus sp.]